MSISNENNLVKYEGKTDLTQVAKDAYKDGGKNFVKQFGQAGSTILEFYNNTIGATFELYNAWARPKINKTKESIENKMLNIPEQKFTVPKINVLGPAMEGLKYNLNEHELREMFENLIVNSCNSDYSDTIHPRFAEIIKQLSHDDALLLKELSNNPTSAYAVANIIDKTENGFFTIFPNYYCSNVLPIEKVPSALTNLQTLGIIEISYENFITDNTLYETITKSDYYNKLALHYSHISYKKGVFSLTVLGRNFVKVCT